MADSISIIHRFYLYTFFVAKFDVFYLCWLAGRSDIIRDLISGSFTRTAWRHATLQRHGFETVRTDPAWRHFN